MNTSQAFFDLMNNAIGKLKSAVKERKTPGELRLLKVPALNLEAMWLAYPDKTQGRLAILPRFQYENFESDKVYDEAEFLKLLSKTAARIKQDDTMGA
jgi:hypothetical protein